MVFRRLKELTGFASKQKWILTELKFLNMLGLIGALVFFSDALQAKTGTVFISRTSGTDIGKKVSSLFIGQAIIGCTSYVVVQGIAAGMSTLCSQAYGAANYKLMGTYFMRALIIASLTCFPIWTIWISVKPAIYYITRDAELAQGAGDYTTVLCFSYPAYVYSRLVCNFLQSQNIVIPNLVIFVSGNLLNICLQYVLIVVLSLEIKGVALSFTISNYLIAILLFAYIQLTSVHLTYAVFSWSNLTGWYHFLKYGIVGTLQLIVEIIVARFVPIIFIGFIIRDTDQLALLGILNVFWFLMLSVTFGFGTGANVRIGNLLGENNLVRAKKSAIVVQCFALLIQVVFSVFIFSFSHLISCVFTTIQDVREQIEFGIKIISLCLVSEMEAVTRGICNACCLQNLALMGKYLCLILISIPAGCVFAYFVSWKAVGYCLMLAMGFLASSIWNITLLSCYNWQKIARKVLQNTLQANEDSEPSDRSINVPSLSIDYSKGLKCLLISRYIIILLISIMAFVFVYCSV